MNLLNELAVGKTIEFEDGTRRTIVEKLPHQDIKSAYYYKFDDGYIERDVRIHGKIVDNTVKSTFQESYDSTTDTLIHIKRVQELLMFFVVGLLNAALQHDRSKLQEPEKSTFDKITPLLRNTTYGSDEYKKIMSENKENIEHHQKSNSHHPEYYPNGIYDMDLFDIVEMFFDWVAASERHADGSILKSIEIQKKRFSIDEQLCQIFRNTAKKLK